MFQTSSNEQEGTLPKFYGKYPGLVKENGAPNDGAHRGELLIEIPGILEDVPGNVEILSISKDTSGKKDPSPIVVKAKPCFPPGFFFIPQAGARVWVEFAAGDINTPIWTGVWYPNNETPKTFDGKAPTESQRVIHTASGHVIQLDDSDGKETIVVKDRKNGNTIILNKDGIKIESADKTISITCDKMTINGDVEISGSLTVGTGPKTTIKGNEITGG